ncbi:MAG: imidazolonepropionase [Ignavibacteria bacterium]|nr:imidazolonepropionase [Ignavibacteria bacterium]
MSLLLFNANQILTCKPDNGHFNRLESLQEISLLNKYSVIVEDGIITEITKKISEKDFGKFDQVLDISSSALLPGLIDAHTHLVFAGSREEEFEKRTKGLSYEDIARAGGGINTTVNATRAIGFDQLFSSSTKRLRESISYGITTIEIKSGYGLDTESEIKMLECIKKLNSLNLCDCRSTFLGAHTIPNEFKNNRTQFITLIIDEMLPKISNLGLAEFCDIFTEKTAFSIEETELILTAAKSLGYKLKLHCDQFNSIGGIDLGIKMGVKSIDHLEMTTEEDIQRISKTDITAVLLPGVSYFLNIPYAPARKFIDSGAILVLATDFNPGSCMTQNLPLIMNLAAIQMKMSINETINAVTINAAFSLGLERQVGSIEVGKQADFLILNSPNYQNLVYHFGTNQTKYTIKKGKVVYERNN